MDAGFPAQDAARSDQPPGLWRGFRHPAQQPGEVPADRRDVERTLAGKVRDAKTAADIEEAHRRGGVPGEPDRELDRLLLRLLDCVGAQVLGAAEYMKALKIESELPDPREHCWHALGIHAELLRTSAHFHPRAFQLEVGVDAHRHTWTRIAVSAQHRDALHLAFRLEIDDNAGGRCLREFRVGLARTRKADRPWNHPGSQSNSEFAGGRYIQPVH